MIIFDKSVPVFYQELGNLAKVTIIKNVGLLTLTFDTIVFVINTSVQGSTIQTTSGKTLQIDVDHSTNDFTNNNLQVSLPLLKQYVVNTQYVLSPIIAAVCSCLTLSYEWQVYKFVNNSYILISTTTNPTFNFYPNTNGNYRVDLAITDCCGTSNTSYGLVVGNQLIIEPTCDSLESDCTSKCEEIKFSNLTNIPLIVSIRFAHNNLLVTTLLIASLSSSIYKFTKDGIYKIEYLGNSNIYVNRCSIDKCYNKLLKALMCNSGKACGSTKFINKISPVQAIYQLFMNKLKIYNIITNYTQIDITNQLNDFVKVNKIIEALLNYCDTCERDCDTCLSNCD